MEETARRAAAAEGGWSVELIGDRGLRGEALSVTACGGATSPRGRGKRVA